MTTDNKEPVYVITDKDNNQAIDFMRKWQPNGYWQLTAISTHGKVETQMFAPVNGDREKLTDKELLVRAESQALAWVKERNGRVNLYFTVNMLTKVMNKKSEKTDMKAANWLHVDVDPVDSSPESRDKCLASLMNCKKQNIVRPTVIIFSGGGYQGFWKLDKPFMVNGNKETCEDFELYNKKIAAQLGGDKCHNIDRIMRLPGTMNIPTKTKLAKGRMPVMARLMEFTDAEYDISEFKKIEEAKPVAGMPVAGKVDYDGIIVEDLNDLDQYASKEDPITDRTKTIIAKGNCPKYPMEDDGSKITFYIASLLQSQGVPQAVIMSLLLDDGYQISRHCLSQKDPKRAAERAITRSADADPKYKEQRMARVDLKNQGGEQGLHQTKIVRSLGMRRGNVKIGEDQKGNGIYKQVPERIRLADCLEDKYMHHIDTPTLIVVLNGDKFDFLHWNEKGYLDFIPVEIMESIASDIVDDSEDVVFKLCKDSKLLATKALYTLKTRLFAQGHFTEPGKCNVSKNSVPLADGNRSLNLKYAKDPENEPMIINTPREDLMYKRLPIFEKQIPKTLEEFKKGKWLKLLKSWHTENPDKIQFLKVLFGQAIQGNPAQKVLFIQGEGGCGKSAFISAIKAACGISDTDNSLAGIMKSGYCATIQQRVFVTTNGNQEKDPDKMPLLGAWMCFTTEINSSKSVINQANLKSITGNDSVTASYKFKNEVSFVPRLLPVLHGQVMPRTAEVDSGMADRVCIITFDTKHRYTDGEITGTQMDDLLQECVGEILYWMMEGGRDYYENGQKLPRCEEVESNNKAYMENEDIFMIDFLRVCVEEEGEIATYKDLEVAFKRVNPIEHKYLNRGSIGRKFQNKTEFKKGNKKSTGSFIKGWKIKPSFLADDYGQSNYDSDSQNQAPASTDSDYIASGGNDNPADF